MKRYIKLSFAAALTCVALTGCNEFLDQMPDNRATLDSEQKIEKIIAGAYLTHEVCLAQEHMSDNTDDFSNRVPNSSKWREDMFFWRDEQETPNESLSSYWNDCYISISACNEALLAMEKMEPTDKLKMMKGEALVARAYLHFCLGTIFCQAYSTKDAESQLGLPYMTAPETTLMPKYERGNLKDFYAFIQADLEEGLKTVGDDYYTVPKYHFNKRAALAFACRFYLYTEQWEKAVEYATLCLGKDPRSLLRNHKAMGQLAKDFGILSKDYIAANNACNLLLSPAYSSLGVTYGAYTSNGRYNHGKHVADTETLLATQLWGASTNLYVGPQYYQGSTYNKVVWPKMPYLFEYTDLNAGIGLTHSVYTHFTTDECLINRAEAYTMLKQYDLAAADLDMWMHNVANTNTVLTPTIITNFYKAQKYSYVVDKDKPTEAQKLVGTLKKYLNPKFAIDTVGSTQESMLQCVLGFRRFEVMHTGLRWQDIKRYGIEIPRREMDANATPAKLLDVLKVDDNRRAMQVPATVISAGFEANPR